MRHIIDNELRQFVALLKELTELFYEFCYNGAREYETTPALP